MADHVWTVYCSEAAVSRETNQVSLLSVIEALGAHLELVEEAPPISPDEPFLIPEAGELVSLWARREPDTPEVASARVRVIAPSGQAIVTLREYEVDLREVLRRTVRIKMTTFPAVGSGIHSFSVEQAAPRGWEDVARVPVEVSFEVTRGPIE